MAAHAIAMKINFACGRQVLDGFFNVDAVRHPKAPRDPELIHAVEFDPDGSIRNPLPLDDGCADELQAMHIIEHVFAWEAPSLVGEWYRLLKPGGMLVVECPDIEHAARNLLAVLPDQMNLWPFYGDPGPKDPFMCHKWGYTKRTLQGVLIRAGFESVKALPPQTHGARLNRDMRMEARKPC
jgi:predicted SAM-dependent methyltransferase